MQDIIGLSLSVITLLILLTVIPRVVRDYRHREEKDIQKVKVILGIGVLVVAILSIAPILRLFILIFFEQKLALVDSLAFYANRISFLALAVLARVLYTNKRIIERK